jgi:Amt family ammonium transporter
MSLLMMATVLVALSQTGFILTETGATRQKNAGNAVIKSLAGFAVSVLAFVLIGSGFMFGGNPVIGTFQVNFFSVGGEAGLPIAMMFHAVMCAASAVIVSGALAERAKFSSYLIFCGIYAVIIYPMIAHWVWGGGWLQSVFGFHDFAGGSVLHMAGGAAALIGTMILGPRLGKYDEQNRSVAIPGHSPSKSAVGAMILMFSWMGFAGYSLIMPKNGDIGATQTSETFDFALLGNTLGNLLPVFLLSACASALTALIITRIRFGKIDISLTVSAFIGGLVAVSAGCNLYYPWAAVIIGVVAGVIIVFGIPILDRKCHVDDPVGAVTVHGMCGLFGVIAVGLFANGGAAASGSIADDSAVKGVFFGGGMSQLAVQLLGAAAIVAFVTVVSIVVFILLKATVGLRSSRNAELVGQDNSEHGISSYRDYIPVRYVRTDDERRIPISSEQHAQESGENTGARISLVTIITKPERFESLKFSLTEIGITGMTVSEVSGFGMQSGVPEYYRGVPISAQLLPKIKVDVAVCKVPVETVIEAASKALFTGHIGDGKIFVSTVDGAVKIRTGERGYDALQDIREDN